jgi:hypothetical protein
MLRELVGRLPAKRLLLFPPAAPRPGPGRAGPGRASKGVALGFGPEPLQSGWVTVGSAFSESSAKESGTCCTDSDTGCTDTGCRRLSYGKSFKWPFTVRISESHQVIARCPVQWTCGFIAEVRTGVSDDAVNDLSKRIHDAAN